MMRRHVALLVWACCACTESTPLAEQGPPQHVAPTTAPLVRAASSDEPDEVAFLAEPAKCNASAAEGCEEVEMQLEGARRSLARVQAERAQRPGDVNLQIRFVVHGSPLQLDHSYGLSVGDVRVRAIRYWLSQLSFITADGTITDIPSSYYLMEARGEQPLRNGTQTPLTLPAKRRELIELRTVRTQAYTKIAFNVGVDAPHNDDLSLIAGELSVMQNMASSQWMWFTSYIFTQLDALVMGDPADVLEDGGAPYDLHVLWENGSNQDLRRVELTLPSEARVGGDIPRTDIELELDLAMLFEQLGPELETARAATPGAPFSSINAATEAQRTTLADNWSRAFRALRVSYGVP